MAAIAPNPFVSFPENKRKRFFLDKPQRRPLTSQTLRKIGLTSLPPPPIGPIVKVVLPTSVTEPIFPTIEAWIGLQTDPEKWRTFLASFQPYLGKIRKIEIKANSYQPLPDEESRNLLACLTESTVEPQIKVVESVYSLNLIFINPILSQRLTFSFVDKSTKHTLIVESFLCRRKKKIVRTSTQIVQFTTFDQIKDQLHQ